MSQHDPRQAKTALRRSKEAIADRLRPLPVEFPDASIASAQKHVDEFIDDLVEEASRVAERSRSDHASPEHIRIARDHLGSRSVRWIDETAGTLGGLLFGAGLSGYIAMIIDSTYPAAGVGLVTVLMVFGAALLAWSIGRRLS